jgi:hypothetical protein
LRKRDIKKQIWLNEIEKKKLKDNSKKVGLNESEYIRSLIMGYKPKELPDEKFYNYMNQLRSIGINLNQIARKANSLELIDAPFYRKTYNKLNEFMQLIKKNYLDIEKEN